VLTPRRAMRTVSNYESRKRARSPSSPSPAERSSKRQLAAHSDFQGTGIAPFASVAMLRMTRGGDEWVDQTRELRIESPLLGSEPSDGGASGRHDEMDALMREDIRMTSPGPADAPMSTSFSELDVHTVPAPVPQAFFHDAGLSFTPQYASPLIQATNLPALDPIMLPPEPLPNTIQPPFNAGDQTIVDAGSMIDADGPSFASEPIHTSTPSRRIMTGGDVVTKRVHMGYRANCEKCRQKVAGHWMHFSGEDVSF